TARPARECDTIDTDRGQGNDKEHANIYVRRDRKRNNALANRERVSEGDDREHTEGHTDRDHRSDPVKPPLRHKRLDILFEEQLNDVRQRLQEPERADPVRPDAVLHPRAHLSYGEPKRSRRDMCIISRPRIWYFVLTPGRSCCAQPSKLTKTPSRSAHCAELNTTSARRAVTLSFGEQFAKNSTSSNAS